MYLSLQVSGLNDDGLIRIENIQIDVELRLVCAEFACVTFRKLEDFFKIDLDEAFTS